MTSTCRSSAIARQWTHSPHGEIVGPPLPSVPPARDNREPQIELNGKSDAAPQKTNRRPGLKRVASEAGGEQVRGIGARLRSAREKKALTVLQAAEKLHVDARLLQSLEAEEFSALGAGVYLRGHLRRYAELVGESPAQLQQLYEETTPTAQPYLTRVPRSAPAVSGYSSGTSVAVARVRVSFLKKLGFTSRQ